MRGGSDRTTAEVRGLAALLDQVGRVLSTRAFRRGLHPVQWSALRFLAKAGPRARTVTGLATYLGTTMGPASRTAQALVAKGYLEGLSDPSDRRVRRLELTPAAHALLSDDPIHEVEAVLGRLPPEQRVAVLACLETLLTSIAKADEDDAREADSSAA